MSEIKIQDKVFTILDAKEYITLADSFVLNKIGTGHGEAKLYIGNESKELFDFWEGFSHECFFLKSDFYQFLMDAALEYKNPQQNYIDKANFENKYHQLLHEANSYEDEFLKFHIYRSKVKPPRVYVNSSSEYYKFMREVGIPNISYVSVLKLKDENNNTVYYFKMFIDYSNDIEIGKYEPEVVEEEEKIKNGHGSAREKERLLQARIGQGEYRSKLLLECPYCPFTMVNDERLLIASHIKPWKKSNNTEKVDPKNGFILTPTYDKLFDKGFISFTNDKKLLVSPWLSPMNQKRLDIYTGKIIKDLPMDMKRMEYLDYHRNNIFKK